MYAMRRNANISFKIHNSTSQIIGELSYQILQRRQSPTYIVDVNGVRSFQSYGAVA